MFVPLMLGDLKFGVDALAGCRRLDRERRARRRRPFPRLFPDDVRALRLRSCLWKRLRRCVWFKVYGLEK